jgi:hypothetical protein
VSAARKSLFAVAASVLAACTATRETAREATQSLTVAVECADQQLDQAHRVTVTVANGEGRESEVSVYFQPQTHIDAVVGVLCNLIGSQCEVPLGPDGLHTGETLHPDYTWGEAGRLEAEDIRIPLPHRVTRVKVEKQIQSGGWAEADGELKIHLGAGTLLGQRPRFLEYFEVGLEPFVARPLAVQIARIARRPNGEPVVGSFVKTFADAVTVADVHASIASWASEQGMTASYPNPQTLRIEPDRSSLLVGHVWVTFFEDSHGATFPPPSIEWRFSVR